MVTLHHIGIITPDCDASFAFYRDHFGFEAGERCVFKRGNGMATMQLAHLGDLTMEFIQPDDGAQIMGENPPTHFSLCVEDIQAEIKRLRAAGVRFDREDEIPLQGRSERHWLAFCIGPAGERIELMMETK